MWDRLKSKSRFISQLFRRDFSIRRFQENSEEDPAFSAAELTALATGDDRIMAYVDLEAEWVQNKNLLAGYRKEIDTIKLRRSATSIDTNIPYLEEWLKQEEHASMCRVQDARTAAQNSPNCTGDNFQIQIGDQVFTDRKQAVEILHEIADELAKGLADDRPMLSRSVGFYGGFELRLEVERTQDWLVMIGSKPKCTHYDCRLWKNADTATTRLEERLQKIVRDADEFTWRIEKARQQIVDLRNRLAELVQKAEDLAVVVAIQEANKLALEQELGLNEESDGAVIEVDC